MYEYSVYEVVCIYTVFTSIFPQVYVDVDVGVESELHLRKSRDAVLARSESSNSTFFDRYQRARSMRICAQYTVCSILCSAQPDSGDFMSKNTLWSTLRG
jgi:hypothetical protein